MKQKKAAKQALIVGSLLLAIIILIGNIMTGNITKSLLDHTNIKMELLFGILLGLIALVVLVKERKHLKTALSLILCLGVIYLGIFTLIKVTRDINIVMGVLSFSFGLMALIWTARARRELSKGSSLRSFTSIYANCLIFLFGLAVTDVMMKQLGLENLFFYIKYILLSITYILFVIASYKIALIGREFGFQAESKRIKKELKKSRS